MERQRLGRSYIMQGKPDEFGRLEKAGIAVAVLGLAAVIVTKALGIRESFWVSYIDGVRGAGWMAICVGVVWFALASAHRRTSFFALDRKMDADKFGVSLVAIALAVVILIFLIVPRLPATPEAQLPKDLKVRARVLRMEKHLRIYMSATLILTGLAVGSFPAIKFFRK